MAGEFRTAARGRNQRVWRDAGISHRKKVPRIRNEALARLMDAGKLLFAKLEAKRWPNDRLNLNNALKKTVIRVAAEVAGLKFGKDVAVGS